MDIDEYLVPMRNNGWGSLLDEKKEISQVLGMRSVRGRPRAELMVESQDPNVCTKQNDERADTVGAPCLVPRKNETFLHVYNCDEVRAPRPSRFFTNMKQIYRPDFVLSHFVHYTVATKSMAEYYHQKDQARGFTRKPSRTEK